MLDIIEVLCLTCVSFFVIRFACLNIIKDAYSRGINIFNNPDLHTFKNLFFFIATIFGTILILFCYCYLTILVVGEIKFYEQYRLYTLYLTRILAIIIILLFIIGIVTWIVSKITKSLSYPDNLSITTKSNQEIETEQHNFLIKHVVLLFRIRLLVVTFVALAIGYYLWHLFDIISNSAHSNIAAMLLLKQNLLTPTTTNVNDNIQTIINNAGKLKNFYYLTEKEFIATITLTIFAISGLAVLIKMFLSPMSLVTKQNDSENQTPDYARITGKINNDIPTNNTMSALNSFVQSVTRSDNNHEKESKL